MDYTLYLPAETLAYIFHSARIVNGIPTTKDLEAILEYRIWKKNRAPPPRQTKEIVQLKLAWIICTHVCSRWRTIALNDPTLWADIPGGMGQQWLEIFLSRSGNQPISVDWDDFTTKYSDQGLHYRTLKADIVKTHHRRLRNMFTVIRRSHDSLDPSLSLQWPALEDLNIAFNRKPSADMLLVKNAPHLRHLRYTLLNGPVRDTVFPWTAPFWDKLAVLHLDFRCDIQGPVTDKLLDLLARLSCLEHLNLFGRDPFRLPSPAQCLSCSSSTPRVVAISLKTLLLDGSHAMISHLTKHIIPSPSTRIILGLSYTTSEYARDTAAIQITGYVRQTCMQVMQWRAGSEYIQTSNCAEDKDTLQHCHLPYISATAHITTEDPEQPVAHIYLSSRLAFSPHLSPQDWHKGINGVHPELSISVPYHRQRGFERQSNGFIATIMTEVLRVLASDSIRALSLDQSVVNSGSFIIDTLTDPVFHKVQVLRLPEFGSHIVRALTVSNNSFMYNGGSDGTASAFRLFSALRVLEIMPDLLNDIVEDGWDVALSELIIARQSAHNGVAAASMRLFVYLHIADEVEKMRRESAELGTSEESISLWRMNNCIDSLAAICGVSIIEMRTVVPYAALVWK